MRTPSFNYSSLPPMYLISLNTATVVNMGQTVLSETSTSFHVKVGKSLGKIPIASLGLWWKDSSRFVYYHIQVELPSDVNRPLPSSKNPHFQNEAKCTTFLANMSFICTRMKSHFHIRGWALNLFLIQRPRGTRKCPICNINCLL